MKSKPVFPLCEKQGAHKSRFAEREGMWLFQDYYFDEEQMLVIEQALSHLQGKFEQLDYLFDMCQEESMDLDKQNKVLVHQNKTLAKLQEISRGSEKLKDKKIIEQRHIIPRQQKRIASLEADRKEDLATYNRTLKFFAEKEMKLKADVKFWSEKAKELGYGKTARRMPK